MGAHKIRAVLNGGVVEEVEIPHTPIILSAPGTRSYTWEADDGRLRSLSFSADDLLVLDVTRDAEDEAPDVRSLIEMAKSGATAQEIQEAIARMSQLQEGRNNRQRR